MKKLATLLSIIIGGMVWQQMRYLSARRNRVQDRQPMLYPAERFHVITFLDTTEGQDVIDSVRALKQQIDAGPGTLIYAGQAAFTMPSTQLGPRNWDGCLEPHDGDFNSARAAWKRRPAALPGRV